MSEVIIKRFIEGVLETNTYIVSKGADCIIVDPTGDSGVLDDYISKNNLTLCGLLITHGHFDHIGLVKHYREKGVKAYIGAKDAKMLSSKSNLALAMGIYDFPYTEADVLLSDGDVFNVAGMEIRAISTPGHTPGGITYLIDEANAMFSGDTMFRLSYGRTDLYGGDFDMLVSSFKKLFEIDRDYMVYTGHGDITSFLYEKRNNPIFLSE